jgi:hypothetical protein
LSRNISHMTKEAKIVRSKLLTRGLRPPDPRLLQRASGGRSEYSVAFVLHSNSLKGKSIHYIYLTLYLLTQLCKRVREKSVKAVWGDGNILIVIMVVVL